MIFSLCVSQLSLHIYLCRMHDKEEEEEEQGGRQIVSSSCCVVKGVFPQWGRDVQHFWLRPEGDAAAYQKNLHGGSLNTDFPSVSQIVAGWQKHLPCLERVALCRFPRMERECTKEESVHCLTNLPFDDLTKFPVSGWQKGIARQTKSPIWLGGQKGGGRDGNDWYSTRNPFCQSGWFAGAASLKQNRSNLWGLSVFV